MKKTGIILGFILFISSSIFSQYDEDYQSAYMKALTTSDSTIVNLVLESVDAKVAISGVIAKVTATQTFYNHLEDTINAEYVFPGSSQSAVNGMVMTIGERRIVAKIEKKQEAKKQFEQAVKEGKSASLLEQHRPNVFQTSVGNIAPGQRIKVEITYTELLEPEEGVYSFVYPTTVGTRYNEGTGNSWASNPYATQDEKPLSNNDEPSFNINVSLISPVGISKINSKSHTCKIDYRSKKEAAITLNNQGKSEQKDFILEYQLLDEKIESGLMTYSDGSENYFLLMAQPPKKITEEDIVPREYIYIMDISGSMKGYPIDVSKNMISNLLNKLKPTDQFNILFFAGGSKQLSGQPLKASKRNIKKALDMLSNIEGKGSTQLLPALKEALNMSSGDGRSKNFVIFTDGFVTVEKEAFGLIEDNIGEANFYSFGIGKSVNRYIIEGMAHVGHTTPFIVTSREDANKVTSRFNKYVQSPVMTDITIDYGGTEVYDVLPKQAPDLTGQKPLIVFGKYKGEFSDKIKVTGVTGSSDYSQILKPLDRKKETSALKYLWARKKIQLLGDYKNISHDTEVIDEITQLGLKYSLLTEYTSFIALDESLDKNASEVDAVDQTQNISSGAVPEPHEWLLIILLTLGGLFAFWKLYRMKHAL